MPICPKCGSKQPDERSFCDQCGAPLRPKVPSASTSSADQPYTPTMAIDASLPGQVPYTPTVAIDASSPGQMPDTPLADVNTSGNTAAADAAICAACGQRLVPGSVFCHMCGTPTGKSTPAVSPAESADHELAVPISGPSSTPILDRPPELSSPGTIPLPEDEVATRAMPVPDFQPCIPGSLVVCDTNTTICFPNNKAHLIIGRQDQSGGFKPDIDLTDQGGDEKGVSRQHALLSCQDDQVYIQDLGSSNGTYVNQQQLKPRQPHLLHDLDTIWLGHVKLTYKV